MQETLDLFDVLMQHFHVNGPRSALQLAHTTDELLNGEFAISRVVQQAEDGLDVLDVEPHGREPRHHVVLLHDLLKLLIAYRLILILVGVCQERRHLVHVDGGHATLLHEQDAIVMRRDLERLLDVFF